MSFQGDVAGLGLGELLQGLARGGREGSLTLNGSGLCCTIGVAGGQIYLLPEPDEDPEIWRRRCDRAWVKDANHRIDTLRMGEIAYATRLENLFQLLDCSGVHFRFEQGPLPVGQPEAPTETKLDVQEELRDGARKKLEVRTPVLCPAMSVEFVLLEYARQADEAQKNGDSSLLSPDDVPCLLVAEPPSRDVEKFFHECDGASTVLEISDRLGWPLRQCRAVIQQLGTQGLLRLADSHELLALVRHELADSQFARAAARMTCWCRSGVAGPPAPGDSEILRAEWQNGKLAPILAHMRSTDARTMLRRLEFGENEAKNSLERWLEMRKTHKHDAVAELHVVRLELARGIADGNKDLPWGEMLKLARNFQDGGSTARAAVMLRTAADCTPDTNGARLELGTRMLSVGMLREGTPWVVEASRAYIVQGYADKAVQPLRTLLSVDPHNRDAKSLLALARSKTVKGRSRRRNGMIALSAVIVLASLAVVRSHYEQDFERRLAEVTDQLDRPGNALETLQQNFGDDSSERVEALRKRLTDTLQDRDEDLHAKWVARFLATQQECAIGDAVVGCKKMLELPQPPSTPRVKDAYPIVADLYDTLTSRLNEEIAQSDKLDPSDAAKSETHTLHEIEELKLAVASHTSDPNVELFVEKLKGIERVLHDRDDARAKERVERENRDRLDRQQVLIGVAHAHAAAGDLERAVQTWRELTSMDNGELVRQAYAREISEVEGHYNAVVDARNLASKGDHDAALKALKRSCKNPGEHPLPWKFESDPPGARVHFSDGSTRVTPFVAESAFGEPVHFEIELAGHESQTLDITEPKDRTLFLSRIASRSWTSEHTIKAPPVSVGRDHIVCDRGGNIACIGPDGQTSWTKHIDSLGGIARAPVFLTRRPGTLLVITEDGDAWILDSSNGSLDGPWSVGSPPREGPIATEHGAKVRFVDGRVGEWTERVKPDSLEKSADPSLGPQPMLNGSDAGLVILRRESSLETTILKSQWTPWCAEALGDHVAVHSSARADDFVVRCSGAWNYIAWEAPSAKIPNGRLWVSDARGLRAFEP